VAGVALAIIIFSMVVWMRLRKAQLQVRKLTFELQVTRGEAHMREREQKWERDKRNR